MSANFLFTQELRILGYKGGGVAIVTPTSPNTSLYVIACQHQKRENSTKLRPISRANYM